LRIFSVDNRGQWSLQRDISKGNQARLREIKPMIDPRPFFAKYEAILVEHDGLVQLAKNAERAYGCSRTKARKAAMAATSDAAYVKAEEAQAEYILAERAFTVAKRIALVAPRRSLRARQMNLFAQLAA
jgi:hypothetical protein